MALNSLISIDNAFQRGHQHCKLTFDNWGNTETGADADSIRYTIGRPIYGIQIAPESEVGEVFVEFNSGGLANPAPQCAYLLLPFNSGIHTQSLYCRRGQPYFWNTPATISLQATPQTMWNDEYFPSDAANPNTTGNFGHALGVHVFPHGALYACLQMPTLSVIVFFAPHPAITAAPPWPFEQDILTWNFSPGANEVLYRVFPVQHRERVSLLFGNRSANDAVEARVTGINGVAFSNPVVDQYLREFDLLSAPIVVPRQTRVPLMLRHPEATWLGVYTRGQAGAIAGGDVFDIQIRAD